jgi:hypothetical protein
VKALQDKKELIESRVNQSNKEEKWSGKEKAIRRWEKQSKINKYHQLVKGFL